MQEALPDGGLGADGLAVAGKIHFGVRAMWFPTWRNVRRLSSRAVKHSTRSEIVARRARCAEWAGELAMRLLTARHERP
jgi:hypothetical protein